MLEKEYYNKITNIIETVEVNSKVRALQDNSEKLKAYFEIGKLLIEAQGGSTRAKYGDNLIKKWSLELTQKYGINYNEKSLMRFRQCYLTFRKVATVWRQLNWSQIKLILPIKNENERNYYINQVIINNLSVRELRNEIKNKAFDRLSYADKENIKLIENDNYKLTIEDMIKDPILIRSDKNIDKLNEKVLHKYIIEMLENKFLELGTGFALVGHEYKIKTYNHTFKIDLLFFNIKLNCYIVVEIKTNKAKYNDCNQLLFYKELIDRELKEEHHNETIGILISKEYDAFIIKYTTDKNILTVTYEFAN